MPPLVANVVHQLQALVQSVGTGGLPAAGPLDALNSSSRAIEAGHAAHRDAMGHLPQAWRGRAGDAAMSYAATMQNSAAQLSDRGATIADVLNAASTDVSTASGKLTGLVRDFVSTAAAAGPELLTPNGITMITTKAQQNLGQALVIVNDTQTRLADHTTRLNELLPPSGVPAPVRILLTEGAALADGGTRIVQEGIANAENAIRAALGGRLPPPPRIGGSPTIPDEHGLFRRGVQLRLPNGNVVTAPNERAADAVRAALGQRGVPYVWGGESPGHAMDCSGLTRYAYGQAGVALPHSAIDQRIGPSVDRGHVMPGDLAVWSGHVAMVVGNGQMIEAGDPVEITPIRTENEGMDFYGFFRPTA
jgi:cell wall-associated NlpC family hydrolase